MKTSCIIPCYNLEEFLPTAIISALAQTVEFDEVLVVDDGSQGNVKSICDDLGVDCLSIANHGYSAARNAGVMNTTGDAILFLDADDWLFKTFLERTLPEMEAKDEVAVVCSQVEADGVTVSGGVWPAPSQSDIRSLRFRNTVWVSSLIRRTAFLETGGFIPYFEPAADWGLWVDIVDRGWKVAAVHETLWHWRDRVDGLHVLIDPGVIFDKMRERYPHLYV